MHPAEQLNAALAGRYTIDRLVGAGGMATVYLARDLRHQRNVALKVLKPDLGAVVGVDRFLSEIQVTANLQHPNLLPLFDSGAADNLLFYVMPYIEGESLRQRIDREKQLPIDEAVRIATAVGSALDYAHRHGVIHRDLKPENVLLHEGQPLVADFGIALAVSNAGGDRITQTGLSLGTPQYMSPEQASGDRVIDGRTDVYSLGAVTYEMLTGEAPHTGSTSQAIIARLLMEKPRSVRASRPNVPEHVEAAVECALEKLPADRFATAKEFSEALGGSRVVTRRTSAAMTAAPIASAQRQRPATRELVAWSLALVGIAGSAVLAIGAVNRREIPLVTSEFEVALPDSLAATAGATQAALSLSRDGSTLVFHATRPGSSSSLYLRRLRDRTVHPIRGTDSARAPILSPDGNEVLFISGGPAGGSGTLKRVSISGGTPRTVVDSVTGNGQVSWGDAHEIVYAFNDTLWIVGEDGGQPRLLAAPDSARGYVRYGWPDVLPGGKAALIAIWKGAVVVESSYVGVVTIPGGQVTELGRRGTYPRYSETGHVLYVSADGILNAALFSLSSHSITGPSMPVAEGVRFGTGGAAAVGVARNGTLAYVSGPGSAVGLLNLIAVSRGGVERDLGLRPGYYRSPRVSPDGRLIAFTSFTGPPSSGGRGVGRGRGPAPNPDIWRYELAAKALSRVTTDSASERPEWTPAGERIAYVSDDTTIVSRPLYATGEATTHVAWNRPIAEFDMHRNGYLLLRTAAGRGGRQGGRGGAADVYIVPIDSATEPRRLLTADYQEAAPRISPNGRFIAYQTNRTGRFEIYARPFTGDGAEVSVSGDQGTDPVWSPDGREIFYRGADHVMSAHVTATPRLAVTRRDMLFRDTYALQLGDYDIFPDGREFLMLRSTSQDRRELTPVIVVMNWHAARSATAR